jgi:hypothetical protein
VRRAGLPMPLLLLLLLKSHMSAVPT